MIIISTFLFGLYLLFTVKLTLKSGGVKTREFDLKATLPLRGILVLIVMLSHLAPFVEFGLFEEVGNYGAVAVSVFFFMSGYGLFKSSHNKERYMHTFLSHRFVKLLPPIIVTTLVFIPLRLFCDKESIGEIVDKMLKGYTFTPFAWYVYAIIFYYLVFYVTFKFIKGNTFRLFIISVFTIIYMIVIQCLEWGAWWYVSSLAFPLGMIYCYNEESILRLYKYKWRALILCYIVPIGVLLYCGLGTLYHWPAYGTLMINLIPFLLLPLLYLTEIKSPFLIFTGKISYEFYILHGIFIHYGQMYLPHNFILLLFVIFCSYISAYFLNKFCTRIYSIWNDR